MFYFSFKCCILLLTFIILFLLIFVFFFFIYFYDFRYFSQLPQLLLHQMLTDPTLPPTVT